jgi:predicted phosphoribosyltransferase
VTFDSRQQAGKLLGEELKQRKIEVDIILGLARGGVVIAAEVAKVVGVRVNALVVRKIGAPGNPEFALGAVAEVPHFAKATRGEPHFATHSAKPAFGKPEDRDIAVWWDDQTVSQLSLSEEWKQDQLKQKKQEIEDYRRQLPRFESEQLSGRVVVLADDGAATGNTMVAAILAMHEVKVKRAIVALPVASPDTAEKLRRLADEVVILHESKYLGAVGQFYRSFSQVSWEEVRELLQSPRESHQETG